ncbi:SRPBCC family protein [Nocardioides jishulii]|uniref:SRPBCC family protein n=1 Tax=Nocardioides jishulii TaxID=2575440 RepID=A0A4U2YNF1_9ACTN|nr:SRPBCC family protein [Nocardioides jishulii]QCX27370.1 SRPBCC family protein [Nocardioides jishulii]TKI62175.1 SRPBCC family protein [Nocardioides jishulii]
MTSHVSTLLIPAPAARVVQLLASPGDLAAWNPALTRTSGSPGVIADAGDSFDVTMLRVLRGTLEYVIVSPELVRMHITVPGLSEDGAWSLSSVDGGTLVEHRILQRGRLARHLAGEAPRVPALRLGRLRDRLRDPATQ